MTKDESEGCDLLRKSLNSRSFWSFLYLQFTFLFVLKVNDKKKVTDFVLSQMPVFTSLRSSYNHILAIV